MIKIMKEMIENTSTNGKTVGSKNQCSWRKATDRSFSKRGLEPPARAPGHSKSFPNVDEDSLTQPP